MKISNVLGVWENENVPPFKKNDGKEIMIKLNDEFSWSLITIKENGNYTNYALKFVKVDVFSLDSFKITLTVENGDNIEKKIIGTQVILKCRMYLIGDKSTTFVCDFLDLGERIYKRIE